MNHKFEFTDQEYVHLVSVIHLDSLTGDKQSIKLYKKISGMRVERPEVQTLLPL